MTDTELKKRAAKLRVIGYEIQARMTPKTRTMIKRIWKSKALYYLTDPEKNRYEFLRFTPKNKRAFLACTSREQQFPAGVFVQRPLGINKGCWKWLPQPDGSIEIHGYR